jgi:hypothetical protein
MTQLSCDWLRSPRGPFPVAAAHPANLFELVAVGTKMSSHCVRDALIEISQSSFAFIELVALFVQRCQGSVVLGFP